MKTKLENKSTFRTKVAIIKPRKNSKKLYTDTTEKDLKHLRFLLKKLFSKQKGRNIFLIPSALTS